MLILPTIFGVNEFARHYADTLANAGMTAAVWDINSGLPLTTDYQECIKRARTLTDESVSGMVTAWLDTMLGELGLKSVAVLGFCIGGRFALLQAARDKRLRPARWPIRPSRIPGLPTRSRMLWRWPPRSSVRCISFGRATIT